MTKNLFSLICVASALSFCFLASAQQLPSTPASAEIKVGDAAIKTSKGETTGAESTPIGIPKEFQTLDDESKRLADSVKLQKGLDELNEWIDVYITLIRDKLEPEARDLVKRIQTGSAELTKKASDLGLSSDQESIQKKRWATLASNYEVQAKIWLEIIAKMQDTRTKFVKLSNLIEDEKELTIETLNDSNLEFMTKKMLAVEDQMETFNLRIRGLVIDISAWRNN